MMPFKSVAQLAYLKAHEPGIAKRWMAEYGQPQGLPKRVLSPSGRKRPRKRTKQ